MNETKIVNRWHGAYDYGQGLTKINVRPWHPEQVEKYAGQVLYFQKKPIAL